MRVLVEFNLENPNDRRLFAHILEQKGKGQFSVDPKPLVRNAGDARKALKELAKALPKDSSSPPRKMTRSETAKIAARARWDKERMKKESALSPTEISSVEEQRVEKEQPSAEERDINDFFYSIGVSKPDFPDGRELIEDAYS